MTKKELYFIFQTLDCGGAESQFLSSFNYYQKKKIQDKYALF